MHRMVQADYYALPGGRVEMGEDTGSALRREMREELDLQVQVGRLLAVAELFYGPSGGRTHELGFYYEMEGQLDALL